MKVKYDQEQYTGLIFGGFFSSIIFILTIYSLILQGITKESLLLCIGPIIIIAIFLGAGLYITKKARKYRNRRKEIINNGYKCEGEVIEFISRRNIITKNTQTYMKIKYYSKILNSETTFQTPAICMSIKHNPGIKCTVYEAYDNSPKTETKLPPILNLKDSNDNIINLKQTNNSDNITRIVDKLDKTNVKSTKVSDTLFLIIVLIFFIIVSYLLIDK